MTEGLVGGEAIDWNAPGHATRAVSEYLAGLEENGAPVTVPASISMTDPGALDCCTRGRHSMLTQPII
jgi:hypothetical protein